MFNADQNMNDGDTREGTSPGDDRTGALGPCACCVALSQVLRDPCQSQERVAALTTVRRGKGQQLALLSRLAGWSGRGAAKKGQDKEGGPPDSREKGEASGMDAGNGSAESAPVVGTEQDDKSAVHRPEAEKQAGDSRLPVADSPHEAWDDELIPVPKARRLWHGLDGLAVMTFGVLMPTLLILLGCLSAPKRLTLVLLNHPLETIAEILLVVSIPVVNYVVWSSLCKNHVRFSLIRGISLGASLGAAVILALVCAAGITFGFQGLESAIGTDFCTGFCFIAALALSAGACSAYLINRVRLTREFPRSRTQIVAFTAVGAVLSLLTFVGAEFRPWLIRIAERMTVATSPSDRQEGLNWLRRLNPERELRMECSDARAAGLSGLFIPLKSSTQHQLYFALTGKPYSFRDSSNTDLSSLPDDYLSRHVVGDKVKGLSLTRSSMTGAIHPDTLSSTVNWTLVFKNDSAYPQEARAEIRVPHGAVITGLTLWTNGEPRDASFAASGKVDGVSNWVQADHASPAMITDLGRGRVLLHCYPVPQEEELKVRLTMVVPLRPDGVKSAGLVLPRFIAANFDLSGEHQFRLRSPMLLASNLANLKSGVNPGGEKVLFGTLKDRQLDSSDLMVTADRPEAAQPVAVLDKLAVQLEQEDERRKEEERRLQPETSPGPQQVVVMIDGSKGIQRQLEDVTRALSRKTAGQQSQRPRIKTVKPKYVVQAVTKIAAAAPRNLVVVVDGSATVGPYARELATALEKLPSQIPASVIIASQEQEKLMEPVPLAQGVKNLGSIQFVGGQDNLQAVVKAAELAGESSGGAILWIHGPQPVLNREIYIMAPYTVAPRFYELSLDSGDTDTYEFFKNHSEIGPFLPVPRNGSLAADLEHFLSQWQPNTNDYSVGFSETSVKPDAVRTLSGQEAKELIALHANQQSLQLIEKRQASKAARLAVAYGLITPVSSALVLDGSFAATGDVSDAGSQGDDAQLQGASNGTIGPQSGDATVVQGVNTAGNVRVNNLANLEALFNIIANLIEVASLVCGFVIFLHAFFNRTTLTELMGLEFELSPGKRIAIGLGLIMLGLAAPGMLNWFVASARDANLFS